MSSHVNNTGKLYFLPFLWSDSVESRMQKLLSRISSTIIANITIKAFDDLDEVEVCFELIPLGYA